MKQKLSGLAISITFILAMVFGFMATINIHSAKAANWKIMPLDETSTKHQFALDSLLTLRFQLFQKAQFLTA